MRFWNQKDQFGNQAQAMNALNEDKGRPQIPSLEGEREDRGIPVDGFGGTPDLFEIIGKITFLAESLGMN